uniref:PlrA plasmid regulatory protein n=1 Tax=Sulfolobus neozealandicus TaxID=299422 RepID=Q5DVD9_9CREN|nr:PlrA plasmid regulatory protein [Sulfolobus neozealandicus]
MEAKKLTRTQLIIAILSSAPGHCLSYRELLEKTGLTESQLKVYIHRLKAKGIIESEWITKDKKRERIYCLKM